MNVLFKLNWHPMVAPVQWGLTSYFDITPAICCATTLSYAQGPELTLCTPSIVMASSFLACTTLWDVYIYLLRDISQLAVMNHIPWYSCLVVAPSHCHVKGLPVSPAESSGSDPVWLLRPKYQPSPSPRFLVTPGCTCHLEGEERDRCWGRVL